MNVLIACEESQRVCQAFRDKGHTAFSCDIKKTTGQHPEWHIKQDVKPLLNGFCTFSTLDGSTHTINSKWDLIIGFPPCTYFSTAGARWLFPDGELNQDRYNKGLEMKELFMAIYNADCERICIENPIPMKIWELPQHSQQIEPYMFGEPYKKKTRLWLKGLQQLKPTEVIKDNLQSWVNGGTMRSDGTRREDSGVKNSPKQRSKTFIGIARAMANQWG